MKAIGRRLLRFGAIGVVVLLGASCTEAPTASDVIGDLPGEIAEQAVPGQTLPPTVECLSPANYHTVESEGPLSTVQVTWATNVTDGLRNGVYQLAWYDNGNRLGITRSTGLVEAQLESGEHLLTLALLDSNGKSLSNPTSRCSIRVRITKPCDSDSDCTDNFVCNVTRCEADGNGSKRCVFEPVSELSCCQQAFECSFGRYCDQTNNQCVDCRNSADCSDGNQCTVDSCVEGKCLSQKADPNCCDCSVPSGASSARCDDGKACTVDSCDCETGQCSYLPRAAGATQCCETGDHSACVDGDSCNVDLCVDNRCQHLPRPDAGPDCDSGRTGTSATADTALPFGQSHSEVGFQSTSGVFAGPLKAMGRGIYSQVLYPTQNHSVIVKPVGASQGIAVSAGLQPHVGKPAFVDVALSNASGSVYSGQPVTHALVQVTDQWGLPVSGASVKLATTIENLSASCSTGPEGRCQATLKFPSNVFKSNAKIAISATAGDVTTTAELNAVKALVAPKISAGNAGLLLTDSPHWFAGHQYTAQVVLNAGSHLVGAYDFSIQFNDQAVKVVQVRSVHPQFSEPVWHAENGVLKLNSMLNNLADPGVAGESLGLAEVTFEVLASQMPQPIELSGKLVNLTNAARFAVSTDRPMTISSAPLATPLLPTAMVALPRTHRHFVRAGEPLEFVATQLLPDGTVTQSMYSAKADKQPGLQRVNVAIDGLVAEGRAWTATLKTVEARLNRSTLRRIEGLGGQFQSARLSVWNVWETKGQTVETEITSSVVVKPGPGMKYDVATQSLTVTRDGTFSAQVFDRAGALLSSVKVGADSTNPVAIEQVRVVAPCQVKSISTERASVGTGALIHTFGVTSHLRSHDATCTVQAVANFADGTTMLLGDDSGVRFESLRPDLVTLIGRNIQALENGNALLRATLAHKGNVVAQGETAVSVQLPRATRLIAKLTTKAIAASSGDPAATVKGLRSSAEISVWAEYADGARHLVTSDAVFDTRNTAVVCSAAGRCTAGGGNAGTGVVEVRVPRHPHLVATREIQVVRATELAVQLHAPVILSGESTPLSSLARIENTKIWQDARVQVLMTYSDGSSSDVSTQAATEIRAVKPGTSQSSRGVVRLVGSQLTAVAPGQVDLLASAYGLQARLSPVNILDKHVDVVALQTSAPATFNGVHGTANRGLDVIARLSDGSHRRVSGAQTIPGLLTYKSTVPAAATIDSRGMVTVLANRSTMFHVALNDAANAGDGSVAPAEVAVDCNLVAAVGDLDLGDEAGLALKDRQIGDTFKLSARLNTGNSALGAFDVLLTYDPAVVRITGVTAATDARNAVFNANWQGEPGKIYVTGSLHPDGQQRTGQVTLFDLHLTALKGGSGVTEFAGTVRSVVSMNGVTIGEPTPRPMIAGFGELDPNCADEPIYGDANDNCSFGAEDPLFVQRYLAGQVVATDAQKLKMDAFPDGQLTVADALYLSQVLAKLTHFVKLKLSGNDDGGLAYVDVHVIDRDQKTVNSDLEVLLEAKAEKSPDSLVLEFAKGVGKDASTRLGTTKLVTVDNIDYFRGGIKAVEIPSGSSTNKVSVALVLTTKKATGDILKSVAFLGSEEVTGSNFKALKVIEFPLSGNKGCNTDADCDSNHWCDNTVGPGAGSPLSYLCKPKKDDGKQCPKSGSCKSNHCKNAFCCQKGDCCTEKSQCEADYTKPSSCSDVASCQGARKLAQCTNFMCHSLPINDDKGCTKDVAADLCGCYKSVFCDGTESQTAPTCPTSCTSDTECDNSCHCDGTCEADLQNGSACDEDSDCISNYCNNGVCCDEGLCCTNDGACSSLSVAASCSDPTTCQGTHTVGQCNPVSFQCEALSVDDDSACTSDVTAQTCPCSIDQTCNGSTTQTPPQCPIGGCVGEDNTNCKEACHCDLSVCVEDLDDGSACDENSDCKSNYCNNGFCCTNDGSNPVCCGGATHCPGDVFSGTPTCFAGSTQLSTGFSGTQGKSELMYQMYNSAAGYQDLSFGGGQWSGPQNVAIQKDSLHPSPTKAASLGFKVRGGGELRVIGEIKDADNGGGDGVLVELRRNDTVIWSRTLDNGFDALTLNVSTSVSTDDIVRLLVFSRANNDNDTTSIAMTFVLGTCQGQTDVPSCNGSICGTQTIAQDTGCGTSTVVRQCAPYKSAVCNGQAEQQEPACATSCTTSADVVSGGACVPAAPITWMGFDEGSGTVSGDRSGNGYSAQLIGGLGPVWVSGLWGYSLKFSQQASAGGAPDELVELLGTKTLRFGSDFSASALIRWDGSGTTVNQIIVGKGNNWGFGLRSGKLSFHVGGNFGVGSLWEVLSNQSSAIPQGSWVHVAISFNGEQVRLYLNGSEVAAAPLSGPLPYSTVTAVTVGQRGQVAPNTGLFKGSVDSLRLWDIALGGDILNSLVKGLMMPPNANADTLTSKKPVSLLRFDEGKGSNALHEGIGGFSGKLQNGVTWGTGKFGSGVVFTGKTGQQVTLVGSDTVDMSGGFSASGWFKVASTAGVQWLASQFGTFDLGIKDGKLLLRLHQKDGTLIELGSSITVGAGVFHHGAVTFDGTTARIYLDGRQVGTAAGGTLGKSSLPIVLGMLNPTTPDTGVMSGTLDEWLFADYAVSQSVITQSMLGLAPGSGQGSDLFASLPFSYLTFDISSDNGRRFGNLASQIGGGGNNGSGPDFLRGAGVSVGPTYAQIVSGRWGDGLRFNQSGKVGQARQDALEIAVPSDLDLGGGFTVGLWLNWQGQGAHSLQWLVNKVGQLGVGIENGKVFVSISGDAALKASTLALNVVPTQGQWTHLVVSWDTVQVSVYMNGQLKGSVPFQSLMASGSDPIVVGQAGGNSTNTAQLFGILDELVIMSQGVLISDVVKMLKGLVVSPAEKVAVVQRHNGMPCPSDNGTCLSNVCNNDFCCTGGDCCAHGGQCPGKYTILPSCSDASNCQGTRGDPVCQGFACITSTVDDDSNCLKETVSKTCGCYPTEFCTGDIKQTSPICPTSCSEDTECDADCTCEGACVPKLENGLFCDENADCISDMCVDNTCCSSQCEGLCEACNVNGSQGTCTEVPKGTDPAEECDGTGICGGTCDGNKQCQFPVTTVDCGTCRRCNGLGFCTNFNTEATDPDLDCPLCQVCDGQGGCAPSAQGTDIKNECSESATSSCGTNGVCDGGGACQKWILGTQCTTQECLFGFIHVPDECDGLGTCIDKGTIDCSPFLCDGKVCGTSCASDKDCNVEAYCHEGKCYGKKDPGEKCTNSLDCGDGFCVEGVCCITSCTESCYSCNLPGTEGTCTIVPKGQDPKDECNGTGLCGGTCDGNAGCQFPPTSLSCGTCVHCNGLGDCSQNVKKNTDPDEQCGLCGVCDGSGACEAAVVGTDPKGECEQKPQSSCGQDGVCNGKGGCQLWVSGTECEAPKCDKDNGIGYLSRTCNGLGVCSPVTTEECDPYICGPNACLTSCGVDSHCISGFWCNSGTCEKKKDLSDSCLASNECVSGFCVDNVCCNSACSGECKSCNIVGKAGQCTNFTSETDPEDDCALCQVCDGKGGCTVVQDGLDPLNECSQAPAATCKLDGACDGAGDCRLWAEKSVCVSQSCSDGVVQTVDLCDGKGACVDGGTQDCAPYKCNGVKCSTECSVDSHCVSTHWCNKPVCSPKKDLGDACGGGNECKSNFCADGVCCVNSCASVCAQCNLTGSNGQCTPHSAGTDPEAGCGKYWCTGTGACHNKCSSDPDCKSGNWCNGNQCEGKKPNGKNCTGNNQCLSDFCVDGVCCNESCGGECRACDVVGKAGSCSNVPNGQDIDEECAGTGTCGGVCNGQAKCFFPPTDQNCGTCRRCNGAGGCGFVASGADPDANCQLCEACNGNGSCVNAVLGTDVKNECNESAPESCGLTGGCSGKGTCGFYATDVICKAESCTGTTHQFADKCSGTGTCSDGGLEDCAPYVCSGTSCGTSCTTNSDCVSTHWCRGTQCVNKKLNGLACSANAECQSSHCANGFCCSGTTNCGSGKSCAQLGWGGSGGSSDVCGATDSIGCSDLKTYDEAVAYCEGAGGRLCSWIEVNAGEVAGTGCSYDSQRIWTSTSCGEGSAFTQAGAPSSVGTHPKDCTLKTKKAYVRCCADNCQPNDCCSQPSDCAGNKSCSQLGWATAGGSAIVCGASETGGLSCSGLKSHKAAVAHCENVGARLCTIEELQANEAAGTGCGYDSQRVWTSSECSKSGYWSQAGTSSSLGNVPRQCTESTGEAYVRCCADVFPAEHSRKGLCQDPGNCTGDRIDPVCNANNQCNGKLVADSTPCESVTCVPGYCTGGSGVLQHIEAKTCNTKGQCASGGSVNVCNDGNVCTDDLCGNPSKSVKSCGELGWGGGGGSSVCGATDSLGCAGLVTHAAAVTHCESKGGRLCTYAELDGDEAAGTGCSYDDKRVWTSTSCSGTGAWSQAGASSSKDTVEKECTEKADKAYVRCCADKVAAGGSGCHYPYNNYTESCYDGPPGTLNVGVCKAGTKGCNNGTFKDCTGAVVPSGESCNNKDDDCDGTVDEENATGCTTYFKDVDDDNFGVTGDTKCLCKPAGHYTATKGKDCADNDFTVNPDATEACNGKDDDCDNQIDEENALNCTTYYKDMDDDGYGLTSDKKCLCNKFDPYDTTKKDDCNDAVGTTYPGAKELCNAVDDDCDNGQVGGGVDEDYPLGNACDGAGDADSCKEGTFVCGIAAKGSTTFNYTGSGQSFVVPQGVSEITVTMWAGAGAGSNGEGKQYIGGSGGFATGRIPTTPGEKLTILVGGGGKPSTQGILSAYPNGGKPNNRPGYSAGGGGGRSAVVRSSTELMVAGGGGGAGAAGCVWSPPVSGTSNGGAGGGSQGEGGHIISTGDSCKLFSHYVGTGGTQTAGGTGGAGQSNKQGGKNKGGDAGSWSATGNSGGGGGDGYYGGGGGHVHGGGGGGSGYLHTSVKGGLLKQGGTNGAAPESGNSNYSSGIATGYSNQAGGHGRVTISYNSAATDVRCINDGAMVILSGDRIDGATVVNEAAPGLDGTIVGSVKSVVGKQDNAMDMTGGYVRIKHDNAKMNGLAKGGQTFTWWAKVNSTPTGYASQHIHKSVSTTKSTIAMYHFGDSSGWPKDRVCAYFSVGGKWSNCCDWGKNQMTPAQGWQHFGVSYAYDNDKDITTVQSYRNGDLQRTCSFSGELSTNTADMKVGRGWQSAFPGLIDEFAWWGYTLSSAEVKAIMQGGIKTKWRNREVCDGDDNDCKGGKDELYTDLGNACSVGNGQCANSGNRICHESGIKTKCNVTGKVQGTSCDDKVSCTHTDVCSGGDNSKCGGQAYTCSGTCRSCDGQGTCIVASDKCFIAGCDPSQPGCGDAGKCIDTGSYKGSSGDSACHICSPGVSQKDWSAASITKVCRQASCSGSSQTIAGTAWEKTLSTTCPGNSSQASGGFLKCTGSGCGVNCSDGHLGYSVGVKFKSQYTVKVKYADYQHNCNSNETASVTIYACSGNNTGCKKVASETGPGSNEWRVLSGTFEATDTTMVLRVDFTGDACCGCSSSCSTSCKKLAGDMNLYVDNIELLEGSGSGGFVHHSTDYCGAGGNAKRCVDAGTTNCDDSNVCTDNNCSGAGGCSYSNNSYEENCYTAAANTLGVGTCTSGIKTCKNGSFGSCVGEVTPVDELCAVQGEDGLDNNCDGQVDNIGDFKTWYIDKDSDNHGNPGGPTKLACDQPGGYASLNDDCDDNDAKNYPGNTEVCDDQDNNCVSGIDENFAAKGDACDSSDADLCAEGHKVCKADGSGVECGNTDGPFVAYDFDFGTNTSVLDRANADGTYDLVGKSLKISTAGACSSTGAAQFTGTNFVRATGNWGKFAKQEQTVMLRIKPDSACCKVCSSSSKPCGNSCISKSKSCSQPKGCACAPGEGTSGSKYIVGSMGAGDSNGCCWRWFIRQQSHKVRFGLWDGDGSYITSDSALNAGEWNTIAVTWKKGDYARLWLNGKKQTGKSYISSVGAWGYFQMGARLWSGGTAQDGYQGLVDDVVIYPRRLTDAEIVDRMTNCTPALEKNRDLCDGLNNDCKGGKDDAFTTLGDACTEGKHSTCQLSGNKICHVNGTETTCNVTGKASGVACDDATACTHSDKCTGGDDSDCVGKSYSCSGTCRSCDGKGTCSLASDHCYITSCDKAKPGCSGTCFKKDSDPSGAINSKNSGDTSCTYCDPVTSATSWTNRPPGTSWACKNSSCSGLNFDPTHYCNGSGTCNDPPDQSCNDNNKCTDDFCDGTTGCYYTNNEVVYDSNCYTGAKGTQNVGLCQGGIRYCKDGGPSPVCVGEITPVKEICDGLDNDCDGQVDEGVKTTYYRDEDGDGYGNPYNTVKACKPPKGYVAGGDDCADGNKSYKNPNGYWGKSAHGSSINPGAKDVCDGIDNDCSAGGKSDPYGSGADSDYDVGTACNSSDSASCLDSVKVCNKAGNGTMCIDKLVWGSRIFGKNNKMYDVSGFKKHAPTNISSSSSNMPPLKIPVTGGTTDYASVGSFNGTWQYGIEYYTSSDAHHSITGPQMSIAAWVRWTGKSGWNMILNKEYSYEMGLYNGRPLCAIETTGDGYWYWWGASQTHALEKNKWQHVVCTYSKATCRLEVWIDGVRRAWRNNYDNCGDLYASKWHLRIGRRYFSGGVHFEGNLASVGIYDIALSKSEIEKLAKQSSSGYLNNEANFEFCDGLDNDCNNKLDDDSSMSSGLGDSCSGGEGSCKNSGKKVCDFNQFSHDTNTDQFIDTICNVTGDSSGASCDDGNACTHSDTCSGGELSKCKGTSYSCSGTCRGCTGNGGCYVKQNTCYITTNCSPGTPTCAGSCFNKGEDPNGTNASHDSGNTSCLVCDPSNGNDKWTNQSKSWICNNAECSGLTYHKADYCNGSGTCSDSGTNNCNDGNLCTDDSCSDGGGCKQTNNTYSQSCYGGPAGTLDVGICHAGTETCKNGQMGSCIGDQQPQSESCNSKDDDCDGTIDEENASGCSTFYKDSDGDGYGIDKSKCLCKGVYPYTATKKGDCDDGNKNANPGMKEKCNNFDDNCVNGNNEEGAEGCTTYYRDNDNDGYGQTNDSKCLCAALDPYDTTLKNDCVDDNAAINPGQKELCNGIDDDCQGGIDEDYDVGKACSKGIGTCKNSGKKVCNSAKTGTKCSVTGKAAGTICKDSNLCTYGDLCTGGDNSYCKGTAYTCDDKKSCTDNNCVDDRQKKCSYPIQNNKCLIGGSCYNNGNKQSSTGGGACKYCNSSTSKTQWTMAPSSWVCNPASCNNLTFHKADYCGNKNGVCNDKGTENCNKGNVCKNYSCSKNGCSQSNKGDNTKCGGSTCVGDTWHAKDFCKSGQCKDGGTTNCNNKDNSCRNGYCDGGCQIQNYNKGTKCGGETCSGSTYNKKDTCDGSGNCIDGKTLDCGALSNQCRLGKCTKAVGCQIDNYNTSTKCSNGTSNACSGNTWYYQDYCNGKGSCTDKGSKNCDASDTSCRDYYCSGGCTYTNKSTSTVCAAKTCNGSCTKRAAKYCNGSGSCSNGGGETSCGGNYCSSGNCTSKCSSNGTCCDTSGDNRTCIGGQCANKQGCAGVCDGGDNGDCKSGYSCINCNSSKCQHSGATYRCYKNYGAHSNCGCASWDSYNNCTSNKSCWYC